MKLQPNKLQKREIMYYCPFFLLISYPINIWHMQQLQHIPTDTHQIVCCVNGQCVHTLRRCINNIHICVTYSQCSCVAQIAQIVMFSKCMWKTHCTNILIPETMLLSWELYTMHWSWCMNETEWAEGFFNRTGVVHLVCVCVSLFHFRFAKTIRFDSIEFDVELLPIHHPHPHLNHHQQWNRNTLAR